MEQALQRRLEIGFALLLLAVLAILFGIGLSYPSRPRELPLLVASIGMVLVLKHLVTVIRTAESGMLALAGTHWHISPSIYGSGSMATSCGEPVGLRVAA